MPATNFAVTKMLSRDFISAPSLPTYWHLCLSTGSIIENGNGVVEPSGNGYAHIQIGRGSAIWSKAENSITSNISTYSFSGATGDWGIISAVFLTDASNVWFYQNLYPPVEVKDGTTLTFPVGSIVIKMGER